MADAEQVLLKVHRTPTKCIVDVVSPSVLPINVKPDANLSNWQSIDTSARSKDSFSSAVPFPFWMKVPDGPDHIQVNVNVSGQIVGDETRECQINVEAVTPETNQRMVSSVKSFTPLLGVGRETTLSPGNMMTFILTAKGQLESRLFNSDRPEVLATKYQTAPQTEEDDWDRETKKFFDRPPPPPRTLWERFRGFTQKQFPENQRLQDVLDTAEIYRRGLLIILLLSISSIFIWRSIRRRMRTQQLSQSPASETL